VWLPFSVLFGVLAAFGTYWYVQWAALATHPTPLALWIWVAVSGLAAAVLIVGWRNDRLWRRGVSVLAVPLCLTCAALALNAWTGYVPSVQSGWDQLTCHPVPGQTDESAVAAMQRHGEKPAQGTIVSVTPDNLSGFQHRSEFVYLPPAWYSSNPDPRLPVIMMIGAEFRTPSDWLRVGDAEKTLDDFVAKHRGTRP
jgi:S-formylglutathione hydrolase FrmB